MTPRPDGTEAEPEPLAEGKPAAGITRVEFDVLDEAVRQARLGWVLCSSSVVRKRDVLRCVDKGWLRELDDLVVRVDGHGFHIEPERYSVGYELTDAGRVAHKQYEIAKGWTRHET